jgi:hypothetical protein
MKKTESNLDALVSGLSRLDEPVWEAEIFRARRFIRRRNRIYMSIPENENCLRLQMKYLWLFEGEYTAGIVDGFCRLLTASGKIFDKNRMNKQAVKMFEIADIGLCDKFHFLENNGFGGITRYDFKFIRDCIAHQNVIAISENSILIPRNSEHVEMSHTACPKDKINLETTLEELEEFIDEMDDKLANIIEKHSPGYVARYDELVKSLK